MYNLTGGLKNLVGGRLQAFLARRAQLSRLANVRSPADQIGEPLPSDRQPVPDPG
jgi:hypothetical protein